MCFSSKIHHIYMQLVSKKEPGRLGELNSGSSRESYRRRKQVACPQMLTESSIYMYLGTVKRFTVNRSDGARFTDESQVGERHGKPCGVSPCFVLMTMINPAQSLNLLHSLHNTALIIIFSSNLKRQWPNGQCRD